ncbi:hypothetical protein H5410_034618 [Solanum commersonii]|uniref:NPH3 domain-containing protein n=1 Tax=Solanum commersonii TaxID=4109 RepID=A0A9J5YU00_SOLCO|nr:hypothetical protein H5410_034618 [Solanum commersonii]
MSFLQGVLLSISELKLTSHCIDAVASRASLMFPGWIGPIIIIEKLPEENGNDPNLNGIRSRMVPKDWWVEDLCELEVDLYKRVVITIKNKGIVSSEVIGEAAKAYAYRRFPGFNKGAFQFNDVSKCRPILDTVVWLLPSEKGSISCSFLLKLLKASISLFSGETVKAELVKRIGQQLRKLL